MSHSRTKYQFFQEASLSQKLADNDPIYQKLAGTDREVSNSIGVLMILGRHKVIDLEDPSMALILDILDVQRKSAFATSEKTNEITKMGLQMPKAEYIVDKY